MKLAMVAAPPDDENLTLLAQLGVRYAVHYDMRDPGRPYEELAAIRELYARRG